MSLVTPAEVKALVNTGMSDVNLQEIIDRVEFEITQTIGAPQTDSYTTELVKTKRGEGMSLFMPTEIHSVTSIVEDETTLDTDDFRIWGGGVIERLPLGAYWGSRSVVTYKPADDRPKRKSVIIDLVRLTLEQTGLKSESVGGEYSYTAFDNWDAEFKKAMKRLTFQAV